MYENTHGLFHYTTSGVPDVWLDGGVETIETAYGPSTAIANLDGLHYEIAVSVITSPDRVTLEEFRFLRVELDLSQRAVAALLRTNEKSVQRWETGHSKLPGPAAVALGAYYLSQQGRHDFATLMDRMADLNKGAMDLRVFRFDGQNWASAA